MEAVRILGTDRCHHSTAEGVAAYTLLEVDQAHLVAAPSPEHRRRQRKGYCSFAEAAGRTPGLDLANPAAATGYAEDIRRDHGEDMHRHFGDAGTSSRRVSKDSYRP